MRAVDIFIAYSHNDLGHKNELKKFLRPLLNTGQARLWDDHEIEGGQDWEAEIKKRLYGADIILLLVSPDSLASDYFYGHEVKVSLERHDKGEASVIPVILRPCAWTITPLKRLEALPEKGRPVTSWPSQDEAYTDIAHKIGSIVESKQEVLTAVWEQEERHRDFKSTAETAEHLFHKKQWAEAQKAFASALVWFQPGFSPDQTTLENRMDACAAALKQEKEVAERQHRQKEYEALLASADVAEDPKQTVQILQQALKLYQPGFPGSPESLHERLQAARNPPKRIAVAPEPTTAPDQTKPFNSRVLLLGGIAFLLVVLAVFAIRQCSRDGNKPAGTTTQQPRQTIPAAPATRWQSATTIPAVQDWLNKYPQADAKDRTEANQRLETLRRERKQDITDAKRAIQYKDYGDAEKYIQNVLKVSPNDEEALQLKKKLPKH